MAGETQAAADSRPVTRWSEGVGICEFSSSLWDFPGVRQVNGPFVPIDIIALPCSWSGFSCGKIRRKQGADMFHTLFTKGKLQG